MHAAEKKVEDLTNFKALQDEINKAQQAVANTQKVVDDLTPSSSSSSSKEESSAIFKFI